MSELQISTEEIEYCKIRVNYKADSKVVSEKNKEAINELRTLPVPGFRPGKATDQAIKTKYRDRIHQWVEREMLNHAHNDVLYETKMVNIAQPQIEKSSLNGNDFSCKMLYLKKPDFELKQYKDFEIPFPHMETSAEQMAELLLQKIREQYSDVRPYEDGEFIQVGDKITLDYTVGESVNDGQIYIVGSKAVSSDFDENLFGMSPGDEREFDIDLNGKKTHCKVNFHMGMKQTPAPVDDELAKKCGTQDVAALESTVKSIGESQWKANRDALVAEQIKARLVAGHDFEAPPWLVLMEAQHLAMQEGFKTWESVAEEVKTTYLNRGKDNVKFTLILDSINKAEPDTVLNELECLGMIKQMAAQRGIRNIDQWLQGAAQNGQLQGLVAKAKNDHTCQWLVDNSKVVE
jgi:trigger factor